ncbi:DUF2231 domain-containing protein [Streptomyces palmae]|uniref:DUF2231 domain-containing protein n=1 Tax=Streptomyces palmae TaxID=1701085 RepID=A0A4Z0HGB3_9ACTN|nr:DUF2231 domain-containing protein [Streptomyces palmae]TGB19149.1 hypothetical protein E4099_00950 [Streptomyces palmae]
MSTIDGLPAHVLLVHMIVVLVPLTAAALVAAALSPSAARRLGLVLPLLALAVLIAVPVTTDAGEWLERHVDDNALVRRHTELGDTLLPWVVGLFVMAAVVWWLGRRAQAEAGGAGGSARLATPVRLVVALLSLGVAVGAVADVYRIGESGARAAWHDSFSTSGPERGDD